MVVLVWEKHVAGDNWPYMRHEVAKRWAKLSAKDLDFIDGNRMRLVETLRRTYGSFLDEVHRDVDEWLNHGVVNMSSPDAAPIADAEGTPPKSAASYQHVSPSIPSIRGQVDTIAASGSEVEKKDEARWQTPQEELAEAGVDVSAEAEQEGEPEDDRPEGGSNNSSQTRGRRRKKNND